MGPKITSGRYGSVLPTAPFAGEIDAINILLKKGAEVNKVLKAGRHGTALIAAAPKSKNVDAVKLRIEQGAVVDLEANSGYYVSALAVAAISAVPKYPALRTLSESEQSLKAGLYGSALEAATWRGDWELVEELITKVVDVNLRSKTGKYGSPLAVVASMGRIQVVSVLLKAGAIISLRLDHGNYPTYPTALQAAHAAHKEEQISVVKKLIEDAMTMFQKAIEREEMSSQSED
ncbi:hypothetical protein TSTA_045990 [Talaromyces stipitatus ATCC 10500]|uniref:Uncharacterized protein n=1 Tax=Talaromyces stipitatus (strain ATCC 10500 / CBS 375.48 / QM 6759 / NRRL 1006) TaxID=441959 RepID=B8MJE4_TALSN|nr:uncharacterized protein TSTA_045990 [Talaromyces stipitatus ATCC 10500]EED15144.1 hypothetical protein TSTA_045990 [Talaromyces stipitatus ATCC 10500]